MSEDKEDIVIKVSVVKRFIDNWKIVSFFAGAIIWAFWAGVKIYNTADDVVKATKEIPELKEEILDLYSLLEKYHTSDSTGVFWENDRTDDLCKRVEQDSNIYILSLKRR